MEVGIIVWGRVPNPPFSLIFQIIPPQFSPKGHPASVLLEILDLEQNTQFTDH
jgi:ATP-dependent Lon protease